MVAVFEKASSKKIPIKFCPRRSGDANAVYASTERAEKELCWKAKYEVAEMCRDQWSWANNNPWGYQKKCFKSWKFRCKQSCSRVEGIMFSPKKELIETVSFQQTELLCNDDARQVSDELTTVILEKTSILSRLSNCKKFQYKLLKKQKFAKSWNFKFKKWPRTKGLTQKNMLFEEESSEYEIKGDQILERVFAKLQNFIGDLCDFRGCSVSWAQVVMQMMWIQKSELLQVKKMGPDTYSVKKSALILHDESRKAVPHSMDMESSLFILCNVAAMVQRLSLTMKNISNYHVFHGMLSRRHKLQQKRKNKEGTKSWILKYKNKAGDGLLIVDNYRETDDGHVLMLLQSFRFKKEQQRTRQKQIKKGALKTVMRNGDLRLFNVHEFHKTVLETTDSQSQQQSYTVFDRGRMQQGEKHIDHWNPENRKPKIFLYVCCCYKLELRLESLASAVFVALWAIHIFEHTTVLGKAGTRGENLQLSLITLHNYETQQQRHFTQSYVLVAAEQWSPHMQSLLQQQDEIPTKRTGVKKLVQWRKNKAEKLPERTSLLVINLVSFQSSQDYETFGLWSWVSSPIDAEMLRCYVGQKHMMLLTDWNIVLIERQQFLRLRGWLMDRR